MKKKVAVIALPDDSDFSCDEGDVENVPRVTLVFKLANIVMFNIKT